MFVTVKGGLVTALLLAGSLVLGACSPAEAPTSPGAKDTKPGETAPGEAVRGGVLQLAGAQYRQFDFQQETHQHVQQVASPAFNTILQMDPFDPTDSKIVPDLAESWEVSKDGLVYTLRFHKDVKWHDGTPFTAADAKFTLERVKEPPSGVVAHRKDWFAQVDKIELPDEYTMKITLKQPQGAFVSFLAAGWHPVIPRHKVEADQEFLKRNILGTGPFKVKNIDFNVGVELVRNENYFRKGRPYLDGIRYTVMDDNARFAAFRVGRVDQSYLEPQQRDAVTKEVPRLQVWEYPSIGSRHFRFNHTKPPFNNDKVRKAMSLAADRHAMIKALTFGEADLPSCALPAGGNWAIRPEELLKLPGYRVDKSEDLKRAKELLAEAGYPNGFKATMLLGQGAASDNMGLMLKDQVRAIGIELETRKLEFTSFITAVDRLEFEILPYGLASSFDDPDDVLPIQYRTGGGRNYGKFSDPEVDRLIDAQSKESDPEKRKKLAQEACMKAAVEKVGQLEVLQTRTLRAAQPWVKGWVPHVSAYNQPNNHENTWIDAKLKR